MQCNAMRLSYYCALRIHAAIRNPLQWLSSCVDKVLMAASNSDTATRVVVRVQCVHDDSTLGNFLRWSWQCVAYSQALIVHHGTERVIGCPDAFTGVRWQTHQLKRTHRFHDAQGRIGASWRTSWSYGSWANIHSYPRCRILLYIWSRTNIDFL